MGILPHLALFDGRDIQKLKEEALRKRPPCRDASSSKLSRTDSFCNSVGSRSEISLSLEQGESSSQWGDFDRRLRRLLKTRAFSRQQTAPSSKSREEVSNSQQTRKYRPNLGAAMRKQSESSDEFKRSEERETLTDTTMSHSPNRSPGSPPPLPLPTAQAPVTMVPNSLRNSIASFLSETIENGEDDDRSWIEDAHDYLNLLTSTPPGAGKEALSPSHSATRSPSALRDGIAELKIQPKQSAKKETFASPTSSSAANKIAPEKSTKAVVDRSPEEKALLRERRKRQQALTVSLMEPTEGQALRRKALGLSATSSGYESEESTSRRARRRVGSPFDGNLTADNFTAIQADDGHNKWNPRYRVPTHPYGYSKPFSRHPEPSSPYSIPSYVETVERMRRSTDVKPNRGTFGRTKRCSNAELGPPHSHYADSRAIIAANRGIGMPFSGLGEEKDIRDGARWIKQGVRSSSVAPDIRGRRKLTHSPRTVRWSPHLRILNL